MYLNYSSKSSAEEPVAEPTVSSLIRARAASSSGSQCSTNQPCAIRSKPAPTSGATVLRQARRPTASVLPQWSTRFLCRYSLRKQFEASTSMSFSVVAGSVRSTVILARAAESEGLAKVGGVPAVIKPANSEPRSRFVVQALNWSATTPPSFSSSYDSAVSSALGKEQATSDAM